MSSQPDEITKLTNKIIRLSYAKSFLCLAAALIAMAYYIYALIVLEETMPSCIAIALLGLVIIGLTLQIFTTEHRVKFQCNV